MENNVDVKREPFRPMPVPMPLPMPTRPIVDRPIDYKKVEIVEPCVHAALKSLRGQKVCIITTNGKYRGQLLKVKRDHCVIAEGRCVTFVRLMMIVAVTPEPKC